MIYEYKCSGCSEIFEVWAKLSDPPPEVCPKCGASPVERIISKGSFALKGSGWYTTDYKRKGSSTSTKSSSSESGTSVTTSTDAPTAKEGGGGGCGSGACGHNHGGSNKPS